MGFFNKKESTTANYLGQTDEITEKIEKKQGGGVMAREEGRINGLIDKGCSMEGKLAFDGTVQINGAFRGDIVSDGTLIVGNEAQVNGTIKVSTMIVEGSVQGSVEAKESIELRTDSRLIADIQVPSIVIERGATFDGQCRMSTDGASSNVTTSKSKAYTPTLASDTSLATDADDDSLMM